MNFNLYSIFYFLLFVSCTKDTATTKLQGAVINTSSLKPTTSKGYLIEHTYYSISYSETNRQAEWVAYNLTPTSINGGQERTDNFKTDPLVRNNAVGSSDYSGSGYDRGHLCPAADMKLNYTAMRETFYMSNMSPQLPS